MQCTRLSRFGNCLLSFASFCQVTPELILSLGLVRCIVSAICREGQERTRLVLALTSLCDVHMAELHKLFVGSNFSQLQEMPTTEQCTVAACKVTHWPSKLV